MFSLAFMKESLLFCFDTQSFSLRWRVCGHVKRENISDENDRLPLVLMSRLHEADTRGLTLRTRNLVGCDAGQSAKRGRKLGVPIEEDIIIVQQALGDIATRSCTIPDNLDVVLGQTDFTASVKFLHITKVTIDGVSCVTFDLKREIDDVGRSELLYDPCRTSDHCLILVLPCTVICP